LLTVLLVLPLASAYAQRFSAGVKGGVLLNDAVEGSFGVRSEAKRYTVGPIVEIGLPFSWAIEVDALYNRTGYGSTASAFGITTSSQVRANSWEFPILAKRYFARRLYASGGYVVRSLSGVEATTHQFGTNPATGAPLDITIRPNTSFLLRDNPTHGFAAAAGLRLKIGVARIAPEIRYTRWTGRPFDEQGSRGFFVQSTRNQVELLAGISF
jgi:hypothetical protein